VGRLQCENGVYKTEQFDRLFSKHRIAFIDIVGFGERKKDPNDGHFGNPARESVHGQRCEGGC
jgi:hypothetical protein